MYSKIKIQALNSSYYYTKVGGKVEAKNSALFSFDQGWLRDYKLYFSKEYIFCRHDMKFYFLLDEAAFKECRRLKNI